MEPNKISWPKCKCEGMSCYGHSIPKNLVPGYPRPRCIWLDKRQGLWMLDTQTGSFVIGDAETGKPL